MNGLRVLVVDDRVRARESLKALMLTWPEVGEIAEAANGRQALEVAESFKPHLVLIDGVMPELGGLDATRMIKARRPETSVVLLSMYSHLGEAAFLAGADEFVNKADISTQLPALIAGGPLPASRETSPWHGRPGYLSSDEDGLSAYGENEPVLAEPGSSVGGG